MNSPKRIAYYLWRYPILTETFIQREIAAVNAEPTLSLTVIADASDPEVAVSKAVGAQESHTCYLFPLAMGSFIKHLVQEAVRQPSALVQIFHYIRSCRYQHQQNLKEDLLIFLKAVYLTGLLREKQIQHLHTPWADVNAFIGLLAARLLQIPFSFQARAQDIHREVSRYALVEKVGAAQFVVTNTQYNVDYLQKLLNKAEWRKMHQIYNGVPLAHFSQNGYHRDPAAAIQILTVGRLAEHKGFHNLLDACSLLRDWGIDFRCEIVGGPDFPHYKTYYQQLMNQYNTLQLSDCVVFSGAQPLEKVLDTMPRNDIFVLPCVVEADGACDIIPNVVIEAMAMRLPVISTNITGIPEIIDDGINGVLVEPGDVPALAESLLELITHDELRRALGRAACRKVEERFDIDKNIKRYVTLLTHG